MCSLLANGDVAAERAQAARKELAELNRQIRNLAKRCKRAEGKAFERRPAKLSRTSSARPAVSCKQPQMHDGVCFGWVFFSCGS